MRQARSHDAALNFQGVFVEPAHELGGVDRFQTKKSHLKRASVACWALVTWYILRRRLRENDPWQPLHLVRHFGYHGLHRSKIAWGARMVVEADLNEIEAKQNFSSISDGF